MTHHDVSGDAIERLRAPARVLAVALLALGLAACAGTQRNGPETAQGETFDEVNDPLEPINRVTFQVNDAIDTVVLRPVAVVYRDTVPDPMRQALTNLLRNLATPVIIANNALQGDWERAEINLTRLFVNTTVGVGGLGDVMGMTPGYEYRSADFGQTLGIWGVGEGPYLVLPLLGPSNPRDLAGRVVDTVADPIFIAGATAADPVSDALDYFGYSRTGATVIDIRSRTIDELDEIRRSSVDYYAAIRSLYRQSRNAMIRGDAAPSPVIIPDYNQAPDSVPAPAASIPAASIPAAAAPPGEAAQAAPRRIWNRGTTDGARGSAEVGMRGAGLAETGRAETGAAETGMER